MSLSSGQNQHQAAVSYCRDCQQRTASTERVCPSCRSGALLRHRELESLAVAHIDCDAFYAAIEKRDAPELMDKPVIVGGGKRGVVATCCYVARLYGVRSAMPMFKALAACPDAVVIKPDFEKYSAAARTIREMMRELTPLVQPVSVDEAYLDLSGTEALHGAPPVKLLLDLQAAISTKIAITVSIGLSFNRFLAKTASELDKPRGFAVIGHTDAKAIMASRPVQSIHGVGPMLARKLERDGFAEVSELQSADVKELISKYGETGLWLHQRANGIDHRPVNPESDRKSVSSETTFSSDLNARSQLEDALWHVCERTADRAKTANVEGRVVTLKLKTKDFKGITRRTTLTQPTQLARILFDTGKALLNREVDGRAYRLIGIGLSDLQDAKGDIPDLIDPTATKRAAAERAVDAAREKFGKDAIVSGRRARMIADRSVRSDKT